MGIFNATPMPDHMKVYADPVKEQFIKLVLTPDTENDYSRYANVGGVTVDLTSAEYAAWYAEHFSEYRDNDFF